MTADSEGKRTKRIRVTASPCCPVHDVPMLVGTKGEGVRRWYCPWPNCDETVKQAASVPIWRDVEVE